MTPPVMCELCEVPDEIMKREPVEINGETKQACPSCIWNANYEAELRKKRADRSNK